MISKTIPLAVIVLCQFPMYRPAATTNGSKTLDAPQADHADYLLINELFLKGKAKHGFRTIQMNLLTQKHVVMNHKKIIRIMKKYRLFTKIRKSNPYKAIMEKTREHRSFANILDRKFQKTPLTKYFVRTSLTCLSIIAWLTFQPLKT